MAYTINYSGGSIIVPDGGLSTDTSLKLPGREYLGYGVHVNQDLVDIMGSFATSGASGPVEAVQGQVWFDRTTAIGELLPNNYLKYNTSLVKGVPDWVTVAATGINANVSFGNVDVYFDVWIGEDLDVVGNLTVGKEALIQGNVQINGSNLDTDSTTFNLIASNANVINFGLESEALTMAAAGTGLTTIRNNVQLDFDLAVNGGNITTTNGVVSIFNEIADVIDFGQEANFISIGSFYVTANTTVNHNLVVSQDVSVNGGDIRSIQSNFNFVTANVTTLNVGSAPTTTYFPGIVDIGNYLRVDTITTGGTTVPGTFTGYWSLTAGSRLEATYADLAERFEADDVYDIGTVIEMGGEKEITIAQDELSENVFGVISDKPAYVMNSKAGDDKTHPAIAMIGRVPIKARGKIKKGDHLVCAGRGVARAAEKHEISPFNVIGRALENKSTNSESLILAFVRAKI